MKKLLRSLYVRLFGHETAVISALSVAAVTEGQAERRVRAYQALRANADFKVFMEDLARAEAAMRIYGAGPVKNEKEAAEHNIFVGKCDGIRFAIDFPGEMMQEYNILLSKSNKKGEA